MTTLRLFEWLLKLDGLVKQATPYDLVTVVFADANGDDTADFAAAPIDTKGLRLSGILGTGPEAAMKLAASLPA